MLGVIEPHTVSLLILSLGGPFEDPCAQAFIEQVQ